MRNEHKQKHTENVPACGDTLWAPSLFLSRASNHFTENKQARKTPHDAEYSPISTSPARRALNPSISIQPRERPLTRCT